MSTNYQTTCKMTNEIKIEKGCMIRWNKTTWWWFLSINNEPKGYFKTKKEALEKSKKYNQ